MAEQARELSQVAGYLLECARGPRSVHLLGEGELSSIAELLAHRFRGAGEGLLCPARALPGEVDARQLLAFAHSEEALLVLSGDPSSRLGALLRQAQGQGLTTIGLFSRQTAPLAAYCAASIVVPSDDPRVISEAFLSLGHVLAALVAQGIGQIAAPPTPQRRAVVRDSQEIDTLRLRPDSEEGALLAKAMEAGYAPPTDPEGRSRRQIPPTAPEIPVAVEPAPPKDARFRFRCGSCEAVVSVDRRHCGRRGQCPHCQAEFRIPEPKGSEGTAAPAPPSGSTPRPEGAPPSGSVQRPAPASSGEVTGRTTRRTKRRRERRRAPRVNVTDALVRLDLSGHPDPEAQGFGLDDLSMTGLRFVSTEPKFEIGQVVHVAVDFPAFPLPVRFKGEIRRVVPREEGPGFGTGVRFLEYLGDAQRQIKRLLEGDKLRDVRRR